LSDYEWEQVREKIVDNWPRQSAKLTDEQWASYLRTVDRYTVNQVIPELRWFSDYGKFMPKPVELRSRLLQSSGRRSEAPPRDVLAEREEHERWLREMSRFIDDMTDERFEEVLGMVHPAVVSLAGAVPRKSFAVRLSIYEKLTGILPPGNEVTT
jgi:hypothetical protein